MSDDLFFDSILKLASDLSESLIDAGINHLHLAELSKGEAVALRAGLDEGFFALLTEIDGQLPDGGDRPKTLAAIQNHLNTFLRKPDIAESILSSVISGSPLETGHLTERYAALTSAPDFPSVDFSQCLTAFHQIAASSWREKSHGDRTRTSYTVFIGRNLGPLAIGDHAQATTGEGSEPRAGEDLAISEACYRKQVVERYNRLGFGGLGQVDLRLSEVALEDVFVRLTLTVEKVVREQVPPDEGDLEQRRRGLQERSPRRDPETIQGAKETERKRERIVVVQEPITLAAALVQNALIVGEPGAGKSTLLRWLAVTFAAGRQQESDRLGASADAERLPLLVELGRLPERYLQADSRETLNWADFLPEHIAAQPPFHGISPALLAAGLAGGRCLLLCDGLDEIADLAARRRIADSLAEYARSSANHLVLSSRLAGISGSEGALGGRFQRITIQRFTPDDVQRFFRFWYALDEGLDPDEQTGQADALFAKVEGSPKAFELAGTPLLATLLLLIWRNEGALPERRVELYERCCRMLIESWEAHHDVAYTGVLRDIGWDRHLRLLAPLAYTIHNQEQRTDAPLAELAPVLARSLKAEGLAGANATLEAEKLLRTLSLRSGLLQFLGGDRYGFPHLTIQEYLAARYIAAQPDPDYIDLVMVHLHEAWWREVHLLVIGYLGSGSEGAEKASRLMLTILNLYRPPWPILRPRKARWWDTVGWIGQRLATRVDWQFEQRLAWVLEREFILATLAYGDWNPKAASFGIEQSLSQRANRLVKQIFRDPGRFEAEGNSSLLAGAACLFQVGGAKPAVVMELIVALRDSDNNKSKVAADLLGHLRQTSPEVVNALTVLAATSHTSDVRLAAMESVRQLGNASPDVVIGTLTATLRETDWNVSASAADSLQQIGQTFPEDVASSLAPILDEFEGYTKVKVIDLLGRLRHASPQVITKLAKSLSDIDRDVREAAANSLEQLGQASSESVVTTILPAVLGHPSGDTRQVAVELLGRLGYASPEVIAALVVALGDFECSVRRTAVKCLGQIDQASEEAIASLMSALLDSDWLVRKTAAECLGRSHQVWPGLVGALAAVLGDSDWDVRRAAAESLIQLGRASPEVVTTTLATILGNSDEDLRYMVVESLGQIGHASPTVLATLVIALRDPERNVARAAGKSLDQLDQVNQLLPETEAALVAILEDSIWDSTWAVVKFLGHLNRVSPQVKTVLAKSLDDPDPLLRHAAAEHLGRFGPASAEVVTALIATLNDSEAYVRRAAAGSLGQLGATGQEVATALISVLGDSDSQVRQETASSLYILGQISRETVAVALVAALQNSEVNVRQAAAELLGQIDYASSQVVTALIAALDDSERHVRWAVANSLEQLGHTSPVVITMLAATLRASEENVRHETVEVLERLSRSAPGMLTALTDVLHHSEESVDSGRAETLGQLVQGEPNLIIALGDPNWHARYTAVLHLGKAESATEGEIAALVTTLRDSAWPVRHAAAFFLGWLGQGSSEAFVALAVALNDSALAVRKAAVMSLGQLGQKSPEAVATVLATALSDSEWQVRLAAAVNLGGLEQLSPQVIEALTAALCDPDSLVRYAAAISLGPLGQSSLEVVMALAATLDDPVSAVRFAATVSLGLMSQVSPEAVTALITALKNTDRLVRWESAKSLGRLDKASPEVAIGLATFLGDSDKFLSEVAIESLRQLGQTSPEAVVPVLAKNFDNYEWIVRKSVMRLLWQLDQASPGIAVPALLASLRDSSNAAKRETVELLGRLSQTTPEVVAALVAALYNSDRPLRQAAAESLKQLLGRWSDSEAHILAGRGTDWYEWQAAAQGPVCVDQLSPEVVSATLTATLLDSGDDLRQVTVSHLGRLGHASPEVIAALVTALSGSDWSVRVAAAESLGLLGHASQEVITALVTALSGSDWSVRVAAAESLGLLGHTSPWAVAIAVVTTLSDSDRFVRKETARLLGKVGHTSPEIITALIAALGDSDWSVRHAAAESLGQLGEVSPEVVAMHLVSVLDDSDETVRQAGAGLLGQLGYVSSEVVAALIAALGDSNWSIRYAAAKSFGQLGEASPEAVVTAIDHDSYVKVTASMRIGLLDQTDKLTISLATKLTTNWRDSDKSVRYAVAWSLGQLGQAKPEVFRTLIEALSDSEWAVREAAAYSLGQLGQASLEVVAALTTAWRRESDRDVRYAAAASLADLGKASPEMVTELITVRISALSNSNPAVRRLAISKLAQLEIRPESALHRVLVALNRRLHDQDDSVRQIALASIRSLLDDRPIPGYHWVPIRERRERARRRRIAGYWALGIAAMLLIAWLTAVATTQLAVDPIVERFITALLTLVTFVAGAAQVLAWFRRPFWDR